MENVAKADWASMWTIMKKDVVNATSSAKEAAAAVKKKWDQLPDKVRNAIKGVKSDYLNIHIKEGRGNK